MLNVLNVASSVALTVIVVDCRGPRLPSAGVTESHAPPVVEVVACQLRVAPAELVTVTVWGSGSGCPMTPLKVSMVGVIAKSGVGGCPMTYVTGKICVPADELKITVPVYVPGFRPATLTFTAGEAGVTPLMVAILSQCTPSLVETDAFQCSRCVQPCVTPTLRICEAGAGCK